MKEVEEDEDTLAAMDTLASFASQHMEEEEKGQAAAERGDDDSDDQAAARKPFTRTMQKQERDALQKWTQCSKCEKWRKVPYTVSDVDLGENWQCKNNKWDRAHAACSVAQALTDEEIDDILTGQQNAMGSSIVTTADLSAADPDALEGQNEDKQLAGRSSRPARNRTKKVTGGATDEELAEHAARPRPLRAPPVKPLPRNKAKGRANSSKMRAFGKNINEAAEALLGMGIGFADDDMLGEEEGEGAGEDDTGHPAGSFRPGKVVWAKVDGYQWWPAKVVRRRAVPREVGAPPGGPALVHTQIPVVFFTQSGVPGEVSEALAGPQGLVPAAMQSPSHAGAEVKKEAEEAEYAWLSIDSLKPFREGDGEAMEVESPSGDPLLKGSIAAAEQAVAAAAQRGKDNDDGADSDAESMSDSDGGWGLQQVDALGTPRNRPKTRATKPKRGRGAKGNKRARGRNGRNGWDDEDETPVPEVAAVDPYGRVPVPPLVAPVVEGIFGWRWPPAGPPEQQGVPPSQAGTPEAAASTPAVAAEVSADDATAQTGLPQLEADAVAALLGAKSADPVEPLPIATGVEGEPEYLVKWVGKAHVHNEWVVEDILMKIAKRKFTNFKRRYEAEPVMLMQPAWLQPCTFLCRRPCQAGPGWEVLVKWCDLGYENATWEVEGEPPLVQAKYQALHAQLWQRQQRALLRSQEPAQQAAAQARQQAQRHLASMKDQPPWICQGHLYPHQLQAVNWLRKRWAQGKDVLLADEKGLGRTATVITFLQSLRSDLHCTRPKLIAMEPSRLKSWDGEWAFWGAPDLHVLTYTGTTAARAAIHDFELFLAPGCLDGKAPKRIKDDFPSKVVCPDVVLVGYDALASDVAQLQEVEWEVVLLDERDAQPASLAKAHQAVRDMTCAQKLLLSPSNPATMPVKKLLQTVALLDPEALAEQAADEELQHGQEEDLRNLLQRCTFRRQRHQVSTFAAPQAEVVLPVVLTQSQRECYKTQLARAYDVLIEPKAPRQTSHRASQLRAICTSLRKVCDHPHLVPEFEPEPGTAEDPMAASGKLVVLDKLLRHLQTRSHKILLLSHHSQVLDILTSYCEERLPGLAVECIDTTTSAADRHAVVHRFNDAEGPGLLLMRTTACGLGTDLPSVSAVILHDSDWNPRLDMQSLSMAHCIGQPGKPLPVFRLMACNTVEERVQQLVEKKKGAEAAFKTTQSKSSSAGIQMLEDAIQFGAEAIFRSHYNAVSPDSSIQHDPPSGPPSVGGDTNMADAASPSHRAATPNGSPQVSTSSAVKSPFSAPEQQQHESSPGGSHSTPSPAKLMYTDQVVDKLVQWSTAVAAQATAAANQQGAGEESQAAEEAVEAEGDLSGVAHTLGQVQSLGQLLGAGWDGVKTKNWQQESQEEDLSDEGEEEDTLEDTDMHDAERDGEDPPIPIARFWESLLKERHQQLLQQDAAAVQDWREQNMHEAEVSPMVDAADEAGAVEGDEEDEEDGLGMRQSSGMAPEGTEDGDLGRGRKRRGLKGSSRPVGKGRRRRLDEEDEQMEDLRIAKRRKRGAYDRSGRPHVDPAEYEAMQREWQHQQEVMRRLADQSTAESSVVQKAYRRISQLVSELKLDERHLEVAQEMAEMLMMLRPEGEGASDFQDYTLIAVIAVAAHLTGSHHGQQHYLAALAHRFSQDAAALHQVFEYIMTTMGKWRNGQIRMMNVMADHAPMHGRSHSAALEAHGHQAGDSGMLRTDSEKPTADHHHAVAQLPSVILNSDMEAFGNRLTAIVNADFYAAALAAGPVDVPLGPLQALSAHLPADNSAQAANTEEILKQLRQMQEQVALFDRIHNIRVKHIQEEYQKYMERVRSKAQSAIDLANSNYQTHRHMLTARVDAMVTYLQQQYLRGPGSGALELQQQQHHHLAQQQVQQQQQQQQAQQQVQLQLQQARSADSEATNGNAAGLQQQGHNAQEPGGHAGASGNYMHNASSEELLEPSVGQGTGPTPDPSQSHGVDGAPSAAQGISSASGAAALQPPSLPSHFSDQRQQQQEQQQAAHAQLLAQATAGSPREGGVDKQAAPKPPLAPGSKTAPQAPSNPSATPNPNPSAPMSPYPGHHPYYAQQQVLLSRQLNQPGQQFHLNRLTTLQESQVANSWEQRGGPTLQPMRRPGPGQVVLAGHPAREQGGPHQGPLHAMFQQGQAGVQQSSPKTKSSAGLGSGQAPSPLASLVASHPHGGHMVQSGAASMMPPSHPKPIQTGPADEAIPARQAKQAKLHREASPGQTGLESRSSREQIPRLTIVTEPTDRLGERSLSAGPASYGASRMGIAPQHHTASGALEGESHDESTPSRSPSPSAAAEQRAHSMPATATAQLGSGGAHAQTGQSVSPNRRVGMLRGGLVAGAYVDGRQVTTGSQELPPHIGYGFDADDRFNRSAARKSEASRFPTALASGKVESSSSRHGNAPSTARLIITSGGGRTPSGKEGLALRTGSGDLNRPRQAQHAEHTRTFSLVHAPVQNTNHSTESEALHGRQSAAQLQSMPSTSLPLQQEGAALPASVHQRSSQQHAQQEQSVAGPTLAQPEGPKQLQDYLSSMNSSSRVDSLSGWASTSQPAQAPSNAQNNAADA